MHRLARFADARNTAEGKFVAILLSVLLVFSFLNVTMFTDRANAGENDLESSETLLPVEDKALEADDAETEAETEEVETEGRTDEGDDESDDASLADEGEESEDAAVEADDTAGAESDPVAPVEENGKPEASDQVAPQKVTPREVALPVELADTQTSTGRFYLLRPGKVASDSNYKDAWVYVGAETIEGPSPEAIGEGNKLDMSYITRYPSDFPTIQGVDGKDYTYDTDETKPGTYHVEWTDCGVAYGWNVGSQENDANTLTYHVNGVAILHYQQYRNIDFKVSALGGAYTSVKDWPKVIELNKNYTAPTVEVPEGQVFEGWYTDAACENEATSEQLSVATANMTFYGKLVKEKHTLTYKSENEVLSTTVQECEEPFTVADAPTREGYIFQNWMGSDGKTYKPGEEATMPHGDLTLMAQWEPEDVTSYEVRYCEEGTNKEIADRRSVSAPEEQPWKVGQTISDFANTQIAIPGYEFVRVDPSQLVLGPEDNVVTVYYQKRTDISYTVQYLEKDTGAQLLDPKVVDDQTYQAEVTESAADVLGYTPVDLLLSLTLAADNNVITFYYTANDGIPYKVNHYKETLDGSYELAETENLTGKTGATVKATVKDYAGFTCVETIEGTEKSGEIKADGSLELNLYYSRNWYKVTYEYENAPAGAPLLPGQTTYQYGKPVTIAADPTNPSGYTFEGWNLPEGVNSSDGQFAMPAGDVTIKGTWAANDKTYVVAYYLEQEDGTYPDSATGAYTQEYTGKTGSSVTFDPAASDSKSFPGFEFDEENLNNVLSGTIPADDTLTLKAYYKRSQYNVFYEFVGTTIPAEAQRPETQSHKYGLPVSLEFVPSVPGYTFNGWIVPEGLEVTTQNQFSMPDHEIVFKGSWTANTNTVYTVEFYYQKNGEYSAGPDATMKRQAVTGETVRITDDDKNASPSLLSELGLSGTYKFDGSQGVTEATVAGDESTVLKVYFKQQPTVTFLPGEHGTFEASSTTLEYGDVIGTAMMPIVTGEAGYTFTGWSPKYSADDPAIDDVKYIAQWTANTDTPYTIESYFENKGSYENVDPETETRGGQTGTEASLLDTDKETTRSTYVYDQEATEAANATSGTIAGNGSTVLKVYFKQQFKVTFETPDGQGVFAENEATQLNDLSYGDPVNVPAIDADKSYGWKLTGWKNKDTNEFYAVDAGLPSATSNAVYEAQWVVDEDALYSVTYQALPGGSLVNPESDGTTNQIANTGVSVVSTGGVTGATATPEPGYLFVGWYKAGGDSGDELVTQSETLSARDAIANLNPSELNTQAYADTQFLAKFVPNWNELRFTGINTEYDGTAQYLNVQGLRSDDTVTVNNEPAQFDVNDGRLILDTNYENVVNQDVVIAVTRGGVTHEAKVKAVITPRPLTIEKTVDTVFTGFAQKVELTKDDLTGVVKGQVVNLDGYNENALAGIAEGNYTRDWLRKGDLKIEKPGADTTSNYAVTVKLTLNIAPLSIEPSGEDGSASKMVVTTATDAVYDGRDHKFIPEVVNTATTPQTVLTEGADKDYTVSYYRVNADGERVATTDFRNVGTIIAVVTGVNNYKGSVERTYQITPMPVTVTAASLGKVYGAADPTLTASVADQAGNAKPNDGYAIQYTVSRAAGEATGDYAITATGERNQGNYVVSFAPGVFTISPAGSNVVTVSNLVGTNGLTKTYDGEPTWVTPTASVAGSTFEYSLDGRTWTAEAPAFTNAGSYNVWVRANAANYTTSPAVQATVTISPRPITITVNNASKVRGEADPVFTGSITEGILVNANDLGAITFSRTNRTNAVGIYPGVLTANYADNDNYTVTVQLGDFTVRAATTPAAPEGDDPEGTGSTPTNPGTTPATPGRTTVTNGTTPTAIDEDDTPMADGADDTDFDTAIDDAGVPEAIGDEATPMAAAPAAGGEAIDDDATPMGAFEDDHADCWVHWVMVLGIVATAVYGIAVARRRLGLADDIDDYEDQVMGRDGASAAPAAPADGRQAL